MGSLEDRVDEELCQEISVSDGRVSRSGSAVKTPCQRHQVHTYIADPCDVRGRFHMPNGVDFWFDHSY